MKTVKSYLGDAVEAGASDLHLVAGQKPAIRVEGQLQDMDDKELIEKELRIGVLGLLSAEQKKRFEETR